jgi:AP-3 complex subunit delta-1
MLELFAFIKADISSHQTKALSNSTNTTSQPDSGPASDPAYPKSLFLIQPLHARPLHPVPLSAVAGSSSTYQTGPSWINAPIPEGLDLESWIIPPPKSTSRAEGGDENLAPSPGLVSSERKKGKQKANVGDGTTKKKKKAQEAASNSAATPSRESPEEKAARARVSH